MPAGGYANSDGASITWWEIRKKFEAGTWWGRMRVRIFGWPK